MKFFVLFTGFLQIASAQLGSVKSVYLFPMRNGFDQILASRLVEEHLFRVVVDPKTADAVMTDKLGKAFEQAFDKQVLQSKDVAETQRTSFSSGRGTLFLVSKSKEILWSAYQPPKDLSPKGMDVAARKSVEKLKKDLLPPPAR